MGIAQSNLTYHFDFQDLENLHHTLMCKIFGPSGRLECGNSSNVRIEFNFMYRWQQLVPPSIKFISYASQMNGGNNNKDAHDINDNKEDKGDILHIGSISNSKESIDLDNMNINNLPALEVKEAANNNIGDDINVDESRLPYKN